MAAREQKKNGNLNDELMRGHLGFYAVVLLCLGFVGFVNGLGSMTTIAATYSKSNGLPTVCGVVIGSQQGIQCVQGKGKAKVFSNDSFVGISATNGYVCGLKQGGLEVPCWDVDTGMSSMQTEGITDEFTNLKEIIVVENLLCGLVNDTGNVLCWGNGSRSLPGEFFVISAGSDFLCAVYTLIGGGFCWGVNGSELANLRGWFGTKTLVAGGGHACGLVINGSTFCWGRNDFGQATSPSTLAYEFSSLALGDRRTCAIVRYNKTVLCWGEKGTGYPLKDESFEAIAAGDDYMCGLLSRNLLVLCWGGSVFESGTQLSLPQVLPGRCTLSDCACGVYPGSLTFCGGGPKRICNPEPCPPPVV